LIKYLIIIAILVLSSIAVALYEEPYKMEDLKWGENNKKCITVYTIAIVTNGVITGNSTYIYNRCVF